ncbi:MAG: antitoxin VbhA family protein [Helicobacteraceae bacterium]|jgi:hypothetical protein|nr:antitoxin VbhA family protein [Helicobacteraceae bacterium]
MAIDADMQKDVDRETTYSGDHKISAISNSERARRKKAIEFATASVELEGFNLSEKSREFNRRFIDGEISLEEYVAI